MKPKDVKPNDEKKARCDAAALALVQRVLDERVRTGEVIETTAPDGTRLYHLATTH